MLEHWTCPFEAGPSASFIFDKKSQLFLDLDVGALDLSLAPPPGMPGKPTDDRTAGGFLVAVLAFTKSVQKNILFCYIC